MRFTHRAHPGKAVRLAYCLNVHPAQTLEGVVEGIEQITVPLRARLAPGGRFGVGLYLPASVFAADSEALIAQRLAPVCSRHELDAFTVNAFPYGDFHGAPLKERVFEPTWNQAERARWTCAVARVAASLPKPGPARSHLSISTHTGMHSSAAGGADSGRGVALEIRRAVGELAQIQGERIVLALEAEPRANCGDTRELREFFAAHCNRSSRALGVCLDACHAAVEFEPPAQALLNACTSGAGLAKLQYTNALRLRDPARNHAGRAALFAMDEARYLHQVTGRGPEGFVRAGDLPEVAQAFARGDSKWTSCEEWRCHFHVPIDRAQLGVAGLETTRDATDELVELALRDPDRWGPDELHLEIETYTWDVLPTAARGEREFIDSLEREYRHALALLARVGWCEE